MVSAKKIWKDIKRSLGLMLVLVLFITSTVTMPVRADEVFSIADKAGMLGIGYADKNGDPNGEGALKESFVYHALPNIIIDNTGSINMDDSPVLEAVVYLNVGDKQYEVIQYTSNPLYYGAGSYGIMMVEDGVYRARLGVVYRDEKGDLIGETTIVDGYEQANGEAYPTWEYTATYCKDDPDYGFSDEIISYLNAMGITDGNAIIDYLTSTDLNKDYTVKYTLTDNSNAATEYIQTGVSLYDYEIEKYGTSYVYGKKLGYNRIESLTEYHAAGEFDYIKMYKGNIYVDAGSLAELGTTLNIPNDNNSGLYYLNSVYVNDEILYNDGYSKNNAETGYQLLGCVLPSPVESKNEAVEEFTNIMLGKIYEFDDFADVDSYYEYYWARDEINSFNGHLIDLGNESIIIKAYNDYDNLYSEFLPIKIYMADNGNLLEAYEKCDSDDCFIWDSVVLPEIAVGNTTCEEIEAYMTYLNYISVGLNLDYEEAVYTLMVDGKPLGTFGLGTINYIMELIWENLYWDDEAGVTSELSSSYTYYDSVYGEIVLNTITGIVPVKAELTCNNTAVDKFSTADDSNMYGCSIDELEEILDNIGLSSDSMKVWIIKQEATVDYNEDYTVLAAAFKNTLKEEFGDSAYEEFLNYVTDNFVTHKLFVNSVQVNDASQLNTKTDVYGEELEIPLSLFGEIELGKENLISQLWYAGSENGYIVPVRMEISNKEMLVDGKYKNWGYDNLYSNKIFDELYYSAYNRILNARRGTVIFAKVPDLIEEQERIVSGDSEVELKWTVPADNGAEILGYQIAVMPKGVLPTEADYITTGDEAGSYTDIGDNYIITYSTTNNSYTVETNGESTDIYVRAVNVIGAAKPQKIVITNPYDISITGSSSVQIGSSANYDTVDYAEKNVEASCTYTLKDNPANVSISADGTLTVGASCTLTEVTIISTGKAGTPYAGRTASKTVALTAATVNPDTEPDNPDTEPDNPGIEPGTNPDINPDDPDTKPDTNPDAGNSAAVVLCISMTVVLALALASVVIINRKRLLNGKN